MAGATLESSPSWRRRSAWDWGRAISTQPALDAGAHGFVPELAPTPELRECIERYTGSENPPQAAMG